MKKRVPVLTVAALLLLLLVVPLRASLARAPQLPSDKKSPVPATRVLHPISQPGLGIGAGDYAAYGTGTILHADALTLGDHHLAGVDVAFSGAAFASAQPKGGYGNEIGRVVTPLLAAQGGHGRGSGLEIGLNGEPAPFIGKLVTATAPPSTALLEEKIGPIAIDPLVVAELLRGKAQARSAPDGCVLGSNLSYGHGSVLNLNLLNGLIATVADPPVREVSQSTSATRIIPGSVPGRLGLQSEIRETVAPVTFFKGSPNQFTIEVLGEWVLRTKADGLTSSTFYGPDKVSPETIIARVSDKDNHTIAQLTFQQFLSDKGLVVKIPNVAEIAIGEDPRAIAGDADSDPVLTPVQALVAADVVRVKLLVLNLADVRLGHMETAVEVPSTGVVCPGIKVDHTVTPPVVNPGDDFTYTIVVTNPNDCILDDVEIVDTITGPTGVKYTASPLTFSDIGPLGPGESKEVKVNGKIDALSLIGALSAEAVAKGVCTAPGDGPDAGPSVPVEGRATVQGPSVGLCVVPTLTGLNRTDAESKLIKAGCKLGTVTIGPVIEGQTGKVVGQTTPPAGDQVPLGTSVNITVGGPAQCTVPNNLVGMAQQAAVDAATLAGCSVTVITEPTEQSNVGTVLSTNPGAGATPADGKLELTVGVPFEYPAAGVRSSGASSPTGTLVAGQTETNTGSGSGSDGSGGSNLARTGGIFGASVALMLTTTGLIFRFAGRRRRQ